MEGWIKLYRKIESHWISENNDYFHWWCDLLFLASYCDKTKTVRSLDENGEPKEEDVVVLKRGQLEASIAFLVKRWMLNRRTLDRKTVMRFLNLLEKDGMIKRETADRSKSIITINNYDSYQGTIRLAADTPMDTLADVLADIPTDTIKEYIKKERNNSKNKKKISSKEDIKEKEESFVSAEFEPAFSAWLEYKHQRQESYKGEASLKACYNKLVKLSCGDPSTAMAIVEQSMANNWAELYSLKDDNGNGNNKQQQKERFGQIPGGAETKKPLIGYEKLID